MFDARLRVLLVMFLSAVLIMVGRLVQLQVVRADHYRERSERSLLRKPKPLPFVRGSILDRTGSVLVSDEPCWDINIDFSTIAAMVEDEASLLEKRPAREPSALSGELRRWRRSGYFSREHSDEDIAAQFRGETARMWALLADFAPVRHPIEEGAGSLSLRERARSIHERVMAIRKAVAVQRGFDGPVYEETISHAIVTGLDAAEQVQAREALLGYPWVRVEPSSKRATIEDAIPFAHLLGRTGPVTAVHVASDPHADDPFARYQADERVGISGVELTAEVTLRGRRGQVTLDREGTAVGEWISAEHGKDVTLTVHAPLQRRIFGLLGESIRRLPDSSGGAIVVLDVPTREVLALVSYPSYDPSCFDADYAKLRDDACSLPLLFRAVASGYAPGSIVKPLVCLAGLMNGRITTDSRETCVGYLLPDHPDVWRCWEIHGTGIRKAHGAVDVVAALRGSCNVFMYRLGERLGADLLCDAFEMAGIGRSTGIGLSEEIVGINPTPSWLRQNRNATVTPGVARNYSIGQGELLMTPLQAANLVALYACGAYRPVTIIRSEKPSPEWTLPAASAHWAAIRQGIFEVVNDPDGTAFDHARLIHDRYAICGKTGSATVFARPTAYRIEFQDEFGVDGVAVVPADARLPAIQKFTAENPRATFDPEQVQPASWHPPVTSSQENRFAHAWFAGFLQELGPNGEPDWRIGPKIAFSVLVEFGGSGGQTSGPIARHVAETILEVLGPDWEFDDRAKRNRRSISGHASSAIRP